MKEIGEIIPILIKWFFANYLKKEKKIPKIKLLAPVIFAQKYGEKISPLKNLELAPPFFRFPF